MNYKQTTSIAAVSVIATLAMASIFGFQISSITAEEDEDKGYTFGEDVAITAYFKFKQGDEVVPFQVFEQTSGWEKGDPFVFEAKKIVGETPLLHKHADLSQKYRNSEEQKKKDYAEFEVDIILSNDADLKRVFEYRECHIDTYMVETQFDKEEGWNTSKGFSVLDTFEIECQAYQPTNPVLEEMTSKYDKADTKSTMQYLQEQRSYYGN